MVFTSKTGFSLALLIYNSFHHRGSEMIRDAVEIWPLNHPESMLNLSGFVFHPAATFAAALVTKVPLRPRRSLRNQRRRAHQWGRHHAHHQRRQTRQGETGVDGV